MPVCADPLDGWDAADLVVEHDGGSDDRSDNYMLDFHSCVSPVVWLEREF